MGFDLERVTKLEQKIRLGTIAITALSSLIVTGCSQSSLPGSKFTPASALSAASTTQYPSTWHARQSGSVASAKRTTKSYGGLLPVQSMNVMWDVIVNGNDHTSTISSAERSQYNSQGQTFYVRAENIGRTTSLYREHSVNGVDHLDSPINNEGGYVSEGVLGFPYSNQQTATSQIVRYLSPSRVDHATPGSVTLSGYTPESLGVFGYPRFNKTTTLLSSASGNGVTASVNRVAGDAIWSWVYGNVEFINTTDYGRELQSSLFYNNGTWTQNSTEAGDGRTGQVDDFHGSPVISENVSGSTISTQTLPLDFVPANGGASSDQLEAYTGVVIGKNVNLNFLPHVASYQTTYTLPNALPTTPGYPTQGEIPTGYLNPTFDTYWTYDASASTLTNVSSLVPKCNAAASFQMPGPSSPAFSGYGGVIISNSNQTLAMGIYSKLDSLGGPTDYFTLYNFVDRTSYGDRACGDATSKWAAVHTNSWPAGTSSLTTYVVTGSLTDVKSSMSYLYQHGY